MTTANGLIAFIATNLNLLAIANHLAGFTHSQHHRRFAAAVADRFEFRKCVRPRQQVFAAFEQVALEVRSQAVGQNRNVQFVANVAELSNLFSRQELSLVDQDAVQRISTCVFLDHFEQVVRRRERFRIRFNANPRGDFAAAKPCVDLR